MHAAYVCSLVAHELCSLVAGAEGFSMAVAGAAGDSIDRSMAMPEPTREEKPEPTPEEKPEDGSSSGPEPKPEDVAAQEDNEEPADKRRKLRFLQTRVSDLTEVYDTAALESPA